jgi:hypothetical protein
MKGKFQLCLVGGEAEYCVNPVRSCACVCVCVCVLGVRWPSHILGKENNSTFDHLGKTGSDLKLTDFQEKSTQPKSSILSPILALWEVGIDDYSHTRSC